LAETNSTVTDSREPAGWRPNSAPASNTRRTVDSRQRR